MVAWLNKTTYSDISEIWFFLQNNIHTQVFKRWDIYNTVFSIITTLTKGVSTEVEWNEVVVYECTDSLQTSERPPKIELIVEWMKTKQAQSKNEWYSFAMYAMKGTLLTHTVLVLVVKIAPISLCSILTSTSDWSEYFANIDSLESLSFAGEEGSPGPAFVPNRVASCIRYEYAGSFDFNGLPLAESETRQYGHGNCPNGSWSRPVSCAIDHRMETSEDPRAQSRHRRSLMYASG